MTWRDVAMSAAGAAVLGLGRLVAAVQRFAALQDRERPLTTAEQEVLRRVFHGSLDDVRVVEGRAGLFDVVPHPFTLGTTIYLKGRRDPGLLVHEAVHVWQYRTRGARYATEALWAQARYGTRPVGGAYDWRAEVRRGRTRWRDVNPEAQAQFLQEVWDGGPAVRSALAREALEAVRAPVGPSPGH
ncbi:hypothetical protein EV188_104589 [Actinomycetospora succinea]|uniref:DUF4157 domain-containing protein n=1 Tax=Actinomycetospora succinea TaxID=663603 RepID=A0A4V3D9V6_9PSEU|nr:DUF4157 domain-containing protein [Actinomycetospora succinea]TDQ58842.1 hypothetical protein EV188_104589 [Actinomycetospora succinea]